MIDTTGMIPSVSQPTASKSAADRAALNASDFKTFLKLLTAQLRNQDPLSPLDSTQFVQQLATFSSVEQQIEANQRLEKIAETLAKSNLEGASAWIGKIVEAPGGVAEYSGSPLEFAVPKGDVGTPKEVVIRNSSNVEVMRAPLSALDTAFVWSGADKDGRALPNGVYKFTVSYSLGGAEVETKAPNLIARIDEARLVDGAVRLVLHNGASVSPSELSAVLLPPQN